METKDVVDKILEYLKKEGPTNTFKLARNMGMERGELLNMLEKLERKQAVGFKHGLAIFLGFPMEEKKTVVETPKKIKARKVASEKVLVQKTSGLENLQDENKKLVEQLKRVEEELKNSIAEHSQILASKELELKSQVDELRKANEELKQNVQAHTKIVRRTVIKKVFVKAKEEPKQKALQFSVTSLVKNLQQLRRPTEDFMQEITARMPNFTTLHKNIQQLNVPEMFKKNI